MTKRQLIYVPEINPRTFLFFYFKGDAGRSYSFRDYTVASGVHTTYANQHPYTANQIVAMAKYSVDAPKHDTNDIRFWREEIDKLNRRYLAAPPALTSPAPEPTRHPQPQSSPVASLVPGSPPEILDDTAPQVAPATSSHRPSYPVFARRDLLVHPQKGMKAQDLERIFFSKQSEDWVTWNVVTLLSLLPAEGWWPSVIELARDDNPDLTISPDPKDLPEIETWVPVPAPPDYENRSRARMARSENPDWVARSTVGRPVEGVSEIDIVFSMQKQVGFVEAKLNSDISMTTTYDPQRNQIARNIDCLLESAGDRTPFFWMLTADRGPGRSYTQMIQEYREDPDVLVSALPHRSPDVIQVVARNLTIVLWKDVLRIVRLQLGEILDEINGRVGLI